MVPYNCLTRSKRLICNHKPHSTHPAIFQEILWKLGKMSYFCRYFQNFWKNSEISRAVYVPSGYVRDFCSLWDTCMVPYLPQTKNIWCAPIRHTPYPQKREMAQIYLKNTSFWVIFCKISVFRGLSVCLLGARQLFAPGETLIWYSSFLRQKIFGVHPSGTPQTPYLLKNGPFWA